MEKLMYSTCRNTNTYLEIKHVYGFIINVVFEWHYTIGKDHAISILTIIIICSSSLLWQLPDKYGNISWHYQ